MRNESEKLPGQNLFEFQEQVVITRDVIDKNGHVNHGKYISPLCEDARTHFSEHFFTNGKSFYDTFGLTAMIRDILEGHYYQQLFEGDVVTIYTTAEDKKSHILFTQRIMKNGMETSRFRLTEVLVDKKGKLHRVPPSVTAKLNELKSGRK